MPALGEEFQQAREARGLSLSDVAEQIHIRSVYLAQIEKENWSAIGAPVYVRGFLRTYARFLGLDAEQAVAKFNETSAAAAPVPNASSLGMGSQAGSSSPLLWVAGAVAALLVALVIYNFYTISRAHRATPHGAARPGRFASRTALPVKRRRAVHAALHNRLSLRFTGTSWVRVTIDGSVRMEGTFRPGASKRFRGKRANIRAGNAGGVDVMVDGKHVGRLGPAGTVAERTFPL
jgi:transcriptional regulator with XRE-family HTH domain